MAKITAVIDIGSNSITLKVYKKTSRLAYYELKRLKYKIRIGEGSYENDGILQEIPIQRAYEALKDFSYIIKAYKARKTLCIATSALRDAPNRKDFIKLVKKDLGISIKVIDGESEGYLGAISAINLLPSMNSFVSVDIGGGSVEFAKVENSKVVKTISLQLGHVRLNEMFSEKNDKLKYVESELERLGSEFESENIVGIGGTIRELSKYLQKRLNYPLKCLHGYRYEVDLAENELKKLLEYDDKKLNKYISKSRVDTIKDGNLIYLSILEKLKAKTVVVNQKGIREGVYLKDLLRSFNHVFPVNFDLNQKVIEDRFIEVVKVNNFTKRFAKELYLALLDDESYLKEIEFCAKVMNILDFNFYSWVEYLDFGITHQMKVLRAYLLQAIESDELDEKLYEKFISLLPSLKTLKVLFFILKISQIVSKNMYIQKFKILVADDELEIILDDISSMNKQEIESLENPTKYKIKVKSGRKGI